jgi:hypothetical protein
MSVTRDDDGGYSGVAWETRVAVAEATMMIPTEVVKGSWSRLL